MSKSVFVWRGLFVALVGIFFYPQTDAVAVEKFRAEEREYLASQASKKAQYDPRNFLTFTLSNELEVLLIQDPSAKHSSVALDVGAGFLLDPPNYRGIAHYLEHMLFLGTEKYPGVDEFDSFLSKNGGRSNAYTTLEHTNYHFKVNSSAFAEALDRFAQFFTQPLFNEEFAERELKNIDSEYTMNLGNDANRKMQLIHSLARAEHPESRVFQGNWKTLKKFPRKALIDFYEKNYSANLMKLAVITSQPLEEVRANVEEAFSGVRNKHLKRTRFSSKVEDPETLGRLIQVKSEMDGGQLELVFSLPSYRKYSLSTPQTLITFLLNYQGEGSLGRHLKDEGLILDMAVAPSQDSYRSKFHVIFGLTDEGNQNWQKVIAVFYSYIKVLRQEGLNAQFFSDVQKISELSYIFGSSKAGMGGAASYAEDMQSTSPMMIDAINDLEIRFSQKSFSKILDQIQPEKMLVVLSGLDAKTDRVEPLFKVPYSIQEIPSYWLNHWTHVAPSSKFTYPPANSYLPEDLSSEGESQELPVEIRSDEQISLWMQQDHTFQKPEGVIQFNITLPPMTSLTEKVLKQVYVLAMEESLGRWMEPAKLAGLSASLGETDTGLSLTFSGYSDKLGAFAHDFISHMTVMNIPQSQFENLKIRLLEAYLTMGSADSSGLLVGSLHELMNPNRDSIMEILPELAQISYEELQRYFRSPFGKAFFKGFGFGHIERATVERVGQELLDAFKPEVLKSSEAAVEKRIRLPKGKAYVQKHYVEGGENSWFASYQFGRSTPKNIASLSLGSAFLATPFYTEMRTVHSLGYIVSGFPEIDSINCGMNFIIESNQNLRKVKGLADRWIEAKVKEIRTLSAEDFEALRKAALESLDQPLKSFEDKFKYFSTALFLNDGDWDFKAKQIEAIRTITQEEVAAQWEKSFDPATSRKVTIVAFGKNAPSRWKRGKKEIKIKDVSSFRSSHSLMQKQSVGDDVLK
jgi:insulysin